MCNDIRQSLSGLEQLIRLPSEDSVNHVISQAPNRLKAFRCGLVN